MTMEIIVKNNSENYIGRVIEIDHYNKPIIEGDEREPVLLNPGESKEYYLHDGMSIRVEEVEEIIEKQQEPVSPPPNGPRQEG